MRNLRGMLIPAAAILAAIGFTPLAASADSDTQANQPSVTECRVEASFGPLYASGVGGIEFGTVSLPDDCVDNVVTIEVGNNGSTHFNDATVNDVPVGQMERIPNGVETIVFDLGDVTSARIGVNRSASDPDPGTSASLKVTLQGHPKPTMVQVCAPDGHGGYTLVPVEQGSDNEGTIAPEADGTCSTPAPVPTVVPVPAPAPMPVQPATPVVVPQPVPTPAPVPVDVCPNIKGDQSKVPMGLIMNRGNCIAVITA